MQQDGTGAAALTCVLQRLLQAPLRLLELLEDLQVLLHRVSVAQTHTQQNTHSYTHRDPAQDTHIHTDQLLQRQRVKPQRVRVCVCVLTMCVY